MLSKNSRLNLSKPENKRIFKESFKESSHFKVYYRRAPNKAFKAAAIVPVRLVRKAVRRNALRRQIYTTLASHPVRNSELELVVMLIDDPPENRVKIAKELGGLLRQLG